MNGLLICYSYTGRNRLLAEKIAEKLSLEFIELKEVKRKRSFLRIGLDRLLNRVPKVEPSPDAIDWKEPILFVSPVWIGIAASPIRSYLRELQNHAKKYVFIGLSGGSDPNADLESDLRHQSGLAPLAVLNYYVADFIHEEEKITPKVLDQFQLTEKMAEDLTEKITKALEEKGILDFD